MFKNKTTYRKTVKNSIKGEQSFAQSRFNKKNETITIEAGIKDQNIKQPFKSATEKSNTVSFKFKKHFKSVTGNSHQKQHQVRKHYKPVSNQPVVNQPVNAEPTLKIIPLGGQEEVGRNMTVFEYGNEIILVDMGIQFPEEDMPGIDYIVPNIDYLKGKEKNIKGVVFTHGHLDHIGAAPILLEKLGYPPVIGKDLTLAMVKTRLEDKEKGSSNRLHIVKVSPGQDGMKIGNFKLRFFDVEHSIMDSMGVALITPVGTALHMGDWTMGTGKDMISYKHLEKLPRPITLMAESLGSTKRGGKSVTEDEMLENLYKLIREVKGRIIIGTFSSQVKRIRDILEYAGSQGKKVAVDGFSMKKNIEVAKELGYIKECKNTLIDIKNINDYPENKVIVICTGAQGESGAVFSRIVCGDHRHVTLQKNDTVVFSSSVIPGNERTIQRLKDKFYRLCSNVIHSEIMDVHISGHNDIESIEELIRQVKPDYFMPVYANHYFLKEAANVAKNIGFKEDKIFVLDNGHVINFPKNKKPFIEKKKVDTSYVFVDGSGIGEIGEVVLKDRQLLAEDGMFVIVANINRKTQKLMGEIQVTSRGFIYVKDNFDLVNATKKVARKVITDNTSKEGKTNWAEVSKGIRKSVGQYLFKKTERRPMVLPMVMKV